MTRLDKLRISVSKAPVLKKVLKVLFMPMLKIMDNRVTENYNRWLAQHLPSHYELEVQRKTAKDFGYKPLISIIVPVYNPPKEFFDKMIESVFSQTYTNWELVLVDDASTYDWVKARIKEVEASDERVTSLFLKTNHHISGATNRGIESSDGEFIALLDNDDILQPHALFEIVNVLNKNQDLDFIYSDEDKIESSTDRHISPYFKPDWNLDFLYSVNYITHLAVVRTSVITKAGMLKGEYNGAQDWELFLRLGRLLSIDRIYHIPKILYSWRVHSESTASSIGVKPYVVEAQRAAITSDLHARNEKKAIVAQDKLYPAQWRLDFPVSSKEIRLMIVSEDIKQLNDVKAMTLGNYTSIELFHLDETDSIKHLGVSNESDFTIFLPAGMNIPRAEFINEIISDAQRTDIGFVVAGYVNQNGVNFNIQNMINDDAIDYVLSTSNRDVTKHFYSTTRYDINAVASGACFGIKTAKLRNIIGASKTSTPSELFKVSTKSGLRNLYNPYISLL